jgi:Tfp pilus assembly protein PilV
MELFKSVKYQSEQGVSLLELALGMMILSVLSVGVSALVKTGVESQMSHRTNQEIQNIGLNIVDDLRTDIRTADKAVVSTNQLVLNMPTGNTITYRLNGDNFSRANSAGGSKTYNTGPIARLRVSCTGSCFRAGSLNSAGDPRQIIVDSLQVVEVLPNAGTAIDQAFMPSNFSIRNFSFEVLSATEFQ